MKGLSSENKKWRNNNAQSQLRKITDKKGKLESYQRKTIIYGDGFHAPEQRIGKYEFEFSGSFFCVTWTLSHFFEDNITYIYKYFKYA